jgi:nickel transport protein
VRWAFSTGRRPARRGAGAGRGLRLAVAAAALLAARDAAAHEVLHEVRRGNAISVHAWFPDGEPLAYRAYEVFSPADPKIPWQKGRTDRAGWLAFVPDGGGTWHVRVLDEAGHGLDLQVDAGAPAEPPPAGARSTAAFVLRPLVGAAAIVALFAALVLAYRRRGGPR